MGMRDGVRLSWAAIAALLGVALLAPSGAMAANVVNGDFESGTLQGWSVHRAIGSGNWFAYRQPTAENPDSGDPIAAKRGKPVEPPPQGEFAAIADEASSDTLILSQEIALAAGAEHRLSLLAYYESLVPIAVPAPDTLSVDAEALAGQANQQYRIDVMRAGSPIESVAPADVLLTVFRTQPGAPTKLPPTRLTADLSPFAGQNVRLRIAVAANKELLLGGVDAIAVASAPPGTLPPRGGAGAKKGVDTLGFGFGKVKLNRGNGTAVLPVRVPGPGRLTAQGAPAAGAKAGASKARRVRGLVRPTSATAAKAGTVAIRLRPTVSALAILRQKHKLRVRVAVTYRPAGDPPETATVPVLLRLEAGAHSRR